MENLYHTIHSIFEGIVQYGILLVDLIGIAVLVGAVIRALISLIKKHDHMRLELVEGIALSLELKMAGELLRTLIVNEWSELLLLGTIILLHAALTILIHWEISMEKKHRKERREEAREKEQDVIKF